MHHDCSDDLHEYLWEALVPCISGGVTYFAAPQIFGPFSFVVIMTFKIVIVQQSCYTIYCSQAFHSFSRVACGSNIQLTGRHMTA